MSKTAKILLVLIIIALTLIFYLIISSKVIQVKKDETIPIPQEEAVSQPKVEKVDLAQLEAVYEQGIKSIFGEFEQLLNDFLISTSTIAGSAEENDDFISPASEPLNINQKEALERISELKIDLMDLTVPQQYKDLHLEMVLCFSKIKNSIESDSSEEKSDGLAMLDGLKRDYEWLVR